MATSLSLVVIFVPVAFMQGQVGRLFNSFGLTIAFAILVSLFVSFTLTPMLCSRFLKVEHGRGGGSKSNRVYRGWSRTRYAAVLALVAPAQGGRRARLAGPDRHRAIRCSGRRPWSTSRATTPSEFEVVGDRAGRHEPGPDGPAVRRVRGAG